MVEVIVEAIDLRFRGLFTQELSHRIERFNYQTEDLIIADFLDSISPLPHPRGTRSAPRRRVINL